MIDRGIKEIKSQGKSRKRANEDQDGFWRVGNELPR
jgi:hypothetical protein